MHKSLQADESYCQVYFVAEDICRLNQRFCFHSLRRDRVYREQCRLKIMAAQMQNFVVDTIVPLLKRCDDDSHPVVLMTCGIAGSGKSTLAKAVIIISL